MSIMTSCALSSDIRKVVPITQRLSAPPSRIAPTQNVPFPILPRLSFSGSMGKDVPLTTNEIVALLLHGGLARLDFVRSCVGSVRTRKGIHRRQLRCC